MIGRRVASGPMSGRLEGGLERWVPGLRTLREYQRSWMASDLVAGLVLTALLVPVGMGYAQAAGLPPITGLYATIVPLVVYAILGPSRVMVLGPPDSSLAAVIAAVILPRGATTPRPRSPWPAALAVITWADHLRRRYRQAGLRDRAAVAAGAARLPVRDRRHHPGRAAPAVCAASRSRAGGCSPSSGTSPRGWPTGR